MQTVRTMIAGRRPSRRLRSAPRSPRAARCSLCGCNTDQQVAGAPDVPTDYRLRHPITLQEADRTLELFIGSNRGELNPTQRAQVLSFGLGWKREATGGIVVERPVGSSNEHAAADAMREIVSILAASGMPPQSIVVRTYPATGPNLATVRISYPKIARKPGPAALWPRGYRPELEPRLFRKPAALEFRLRHAAQSRRHGRQSGRPGAAARRNPGLHGAAHHGAGEISHGSRSVDAGFAATPSRPRSAMSASDVMTNVTVTPAHDETSQPSRTGRDQPRRYRRPRRAHRAGAARFGAGLLRERRHRRRDPGGRRRPAHGESAFAHPDGRPDGGDRSLSKLADAERHHSRIGQPRRRHPRRRSISSPIIATPARASSSSAA